jgi:hypothetical protein
MHSTEPRSKAGHCHQRAPASCLPSPCGVPAISKLQWLETQLEDTTPDVHSAIPDLKSPRCLPGSDADKHPRSRAAHLATLSMPCKIGWNAGRSDSFIKILPDTLCSSDSWSRVQKLSYPESSARDTNFCVPVSSFHFFPGEAHSYLSTHTTHLLLLLLPFYYCFDCLIV